MPYYPNEGYLYGKYSLPYKLVPATTPVLLPTLHTNPYYYAYYSHDPYYSLLLNLLLPTIHAIPCYHAYY